MLEYLFKFIYKHNDKSFCDWDLKLSNILANMTEITKGDCKRIVSRKRLPATKSNAFIDEYQKIIW